MIRTLLSGAALALVLAGVTTFGAGTARAEETTCTGSLGAVTVDNLRVPDNATCYLTGTYVKGTIKVETNATLVARGVRVIGNVQGENARAVTVSERSRVGGSVQVVQGGKTAVLNSTINGDIFVDDNDRQQTIRKNVVGGNVQAFQNTGGVAINENHIDGNLQCKENVPAPTGGGNIVQGNKEDQCAGL